MSEASKKTATRIQAAIYRHGTITLVRNDEGKFHPLPGHDIEVIGCYSEGAKVCDIEDDLKFSEGMR